MIKPDEEGYSPAQLLKERYGLPVEKEKRDKLVKAMKKVKSKRNPKGKYIVKYDMDGNKHLILKSDSY